MTSPTAHITFVIPVRNDARRLEHCLASIVADGQARPPAFVVVDNGSTDASPAVARRFGATVLTLDGNVAALRNAGVAAATTAYVAFVDADHEIAPGWSAAAIEALTDPKVGAVGAPCFAPADGTWVQRTYDGLRRHPQRVEPAEWFGAGNLVMRRDAFHEVGGFDTSLETCEDVDLSAKLRTAGWRLLNVPAMRNIHFGDPPTLGRLFRGELWRGRDNLRVSLRAPWSFRNSVSMAIPIVQLIAVPLTVVGLLVWWPIGVAALATLLGLVTLRALTLQHNTRGANPGGFAAALAVVAAYDAGRALALVARAGHHRSRTAAPATT